MMKNQRLFKLSIAAMLFSLISGCAVQSPPPVAHYDFGSPAQAAQSITHRPEAPAMRIAGIEAPSWLNSPFMHYRLDYESGQQIRPYANSQWVMPPTDLFAHHLKTRMTQAGNIILPDTDSHAAAFTIRLEMLDFIQRFTQADRSQARIAIRATLFGPQAAVAQKTFVQVQPAPTPDAPGGAQALATASDALISDLLAWLQVRITH